MIVDKQITKTGDFCCQFGDDEPIEISEVFNYAEMSLILRQDEKEPSPSIEFYDGKGKTFRLFIKPIQP